MNHISGLAIFFVMSLIKIAVCLYFWISDARDWKTMSYVALASAVVSLVLTIFAVPESPRFLLKSKKYEECAKVLMTIQRVNARADKNLDLSPINLMDASEVHNGTNDTELEASAFDKNKKAENVDDK